MVILINILVKNVAFDYCTYSNFPFMRLLVVLLKDGVRIHVVLANVNMYIVVTNSN